MSATGHTVASSRENTTQPEYSGAGAPAADKFLSDADINKLGVPRWIAGHEGCRRLSADEAYKYLVDSSLTKGRPQIDQGRDYSGILLPSGRIYLDNPVKGPGGKITEKYRGPSRVSPFYVPSMYSADIRTDSAIPLIITESERSSMCLYEAATMEGPPAFVACAIGGCWGFREREKAQNPETGKPDKWKSVFSSQLSGLALEGRKVYVMLDSDSLRNPKVAQAQHGLFESLRKRGCLGYRCSLEQYEIEPDGEGPSRRKKSVGPDDVFNWHGGDEIRTVIEEAVEGGRKKALLLRKSQFAADLYAAVDHLKATDYEDEIFLFGRRLSRRDDDRLEPLKEHGLRLLLAERADIQDGKYQSTTASKEFCQSILEAPECKTQFRECVGISRLPIIQEDGEIVTARGYDERTGLFLIPDPCLADLDIPRVPSAEEVDISARYLLAPLKDFPLGDEGETQTQGKMEGVGDYGKRQTKSGKASEANYVAALLTAVCRPLIDETVPCPVITSNDKSGGKGYLADILSIAVNGSDAGKRSRPEKDAELRKVITSLLRRGPTGLVCFDNCDGAFKSEPFELVLTASTWSDRLLGQSVDLELKQRLTWCLTGINVQPMGSLIRRTYPIIIRRNEHWAKAREFRIPDLKGWALQNRRKTLRAVYTLARHWFSEGCPRGAAKLDSFERWSHVVGGMLKTAGVEGFLNNLPEWRRDANPEEAEWEVFVSALQSRSGVLGEWLPAKGLLSKIAESGDDLRALVPSDLAEIIFDPKNPSKAVQFGRILARNEGRIFGSGLMISRRPNKKQNGSEWGIFHPDTITGGGRVQ